eukprot:5238382-Amphidinium_carterae.1
MTLHEFDPDAWSRLKSGDLKAIDIQKTRMDSSSTKCYALSNFGFRIQPGCYLQYSANIKHYTLKSLSKVWRKLNTVETKYYKQSSNFS